MAAAVLLVGGCSDAALEERRAAAGANPVLADWLRVADARRGERLFGQCAACHNIGAGAPDRNGPNLHGVMGAPIAKTSARFAYTGPLLAKGGDWTPAAMDAWLASPARFAPGTSMMFAGVRDPLDRADLIAFLESRR
jgi:cytochrome c